jgi:hypothetical protein
MSTDTSHRTQAPGARGAEPVRIRAHHRTVTKLGHWTTAPCIDIAASRGSVVLDLLTSPIEPGDIDIHLDLDHAVVKLIVPDSTRIDDNRLRRVGRGRVKDWTGESSTAARLIKLRGELRNAEIRVHRGGIAILSLLLSGRSLAIVRQAHRDGRLEHRHSTRPTTEHSGLPGLHTD